LWLLGLLVVFDGGPGGRFARRGDSCAWGHDGYDSRECPCLFQDDEAEFDWGAARSGYALEEDGVFRRVAVEGGDADIDVVNQELRSDLVAVRLTIQPVIKKGKWPATAVPEGSRKTRRSNSEL
jgi:hypothetical protein